MKSKTMAVAAKTGAKKPAKDSKKTARTRRQRGYHWEGTIVKRFNSAGGWKAFRLGSPSTGLPDVLAVNTLQSTLFAIEAKSGTVTFLPVPADQIQRCLDWVDTFDIYGERKVILAFKFLSKKRVGLGQYEGRELREYFKVWDSRQEAAGCYCTYEGRVFSRINGKKTELDLEEQEMPFKTKQRAGAWASEK